MQPLACSVCRICVVEKPRQTISPKRLVHLIVKSFLGKKTVERRWRSTSNVQQCQGKKPRRWPEQPAFVSPSLPNDCAVLGTRASLLKPRRFCFASFVHFVATYIRKTATVRYPLPAQFYLSSAGVPPGFRWKGPTSPASISRILFRQTAVDSRVEVIGTVVCWFECIFECPEAKHLRTLASYHYAWFVYIIPHAVLATPTCLEIFLHETNFVSEWLCRYCKVAFRHPDWQLFFNVLASHV